MTDVFREVDEEVRREQLKQLWDRYGTLLIVAVVLLVAGVGTWRGYNYWQDRRAAEMGAQFDVGLTLAGEGKHAEAQAAFARIATQGTSGYRMLARLQEAAETAKHDAKAAVGDYDAIAADASFLPVLRDLAALRAGMLVVDSASYAEMSRRLEPLATPSGIFRHTAREFLALSAYRGGDKAGVERWSQALVTDAAAPQGARARVEVLRALAGTSAKS
ncbi:MAG: tetratricopeptide repeat protein [Proteobacteria bacterium]|nr:tetratricopeptide repeat protein [Pseudomonadota bacterium]